MTKAPVPGVRARRPLLRLRYILLAALLGGLLLTVIPRLKVFWALQAAGPALADYAACMGGPTAPAAVKDGSEHYLVLLRRRVLAAALDEAPFAECARLAARLPGAKPDPRLQLAEAGAFVEYGAGSLYSGASTSGGPAGYSLDSLALSTEPILELGQQAWPFARGSVLGRIQPSRHARVAPHPLGAPTPLRGSGLPSWEAWYRSVIVAPDGLWLAYGHGANLMVYQSRDGGVNWEARPRSSQAVATVKERCVADVELGSFVFSTDANGANITVRSLNRDGEFVAEQPLAASDYSIVGVGCGARMMSVLVRRSGGDPGTLLACVHGGECKPMRSPSLAASRWVGSRLTDVARVGRTTIVATVTSGIVRVGSSHDDGLTWTPLTVAFDAVESAGGSETHLPTRLLRVGKRVLLYSEPLGERGDYWLVASDDLGASWYGVKGDRRSTPR